jgi:hypothetical protein
MRNHLTVMDRMSARTAAMLKSKPIRMLAQTDSASRRASDHRHAEKSGRAVIGRALRTSSA